MERDNIKVLIKNLADRNIEGYWCENFDEAKKEIMNMISVSESVGIGNSVTLKNMNLSIELSERGNVVYDKTLAKSKDEIKDLKRKALLTDWYVTGTNAISMEGHIVNIDHSGNRVAAMLYGPNHVIVVIGINKVSKTLDEAIYRVRNIASPKNAKRAGMNPPCVELEKCIDCKSPERVCNSLVLIEGQHEKKRMKVLIVNENDGF